MSAKSRGRTDGALLFWLRGLALASCLLLLGGCADQAGKAAAEQRAGTARGQLAAASLATAGVTRERDEARKALEDASRQLDAARKSSADLTKQLEKSRSDPGPLSAAQKAAEMAAKDLADARK